MYLSSLFSLALLIPSGSSIPTRRQTTRAESSSHLSLTTSLKLNLHNGIGHILKNDLARLNCLNQWKKPKSIHVPTTDLLTSFLMTTSVQVGVPPQNFEVLVDTGSSNLIVGANPNDTQYHPTKTSHQTGDQVLIQFGSGSIAGNEFSDQVEIGGATVTNQLISVPTQEVGFDMFDGILGLGPDDLTLGTLVQKPNQSVPTITDTLARRGQIQRPLVALTVPLATEPQSGSIDFGAPDPTKFQSPISFAPSANNGFWSATQSITYGRQKLKILESSPGIFDSGTSLLVLPTPAFQAYVAAINATVDSDTGFLTVPDLTKLESLYFKIGRATFEFTPNAQRISGAILKEVGIDPSKNLLVVGDGGDQPGGINFVNGFVWMQRFYSVFDSVTSRVGIAINRQTYSTAN